MLQARRLGKELLVGVHSDEEIADNKGPTVMTLAERSVNFYSGYIRHIFFLLVIDLLHSLMVKELLLLMLADGHHSPSLMLHMLPLWIGYPIMDASMLSMAMTSPRTVMAMTAIGSSKRQGAFWW